MGFEARMRTGSLLAAVAIIGIGAAVVSGQKDRRDRPFSAYYFEVTIGGQAYQFRSVSGLRIETEVIEYQEGGSDVIRKLPGPTRYSNIRLTRPFSGDRSLYDWYVATSRPNPATVDGRIVMFDRDGTRLAGWTFANGFPVKWEGPELDASKNEIPIETLEIAHEGMKFVDDDN
jgi:phage tail-like protein